MEASEPSEICLNLLIQFPAQNCVLIIISIQGNNALVGSLDISQLSIFKRELNALRRPTLGSFEEDKLVHLAIVMSKVDLKL